VDEQHARLRAARRAFISAHHPDRGGNADTLIAGLAAFDRQPTPRANCPPALVVVQRRSPWRRLTSPVNRWHRRPPPRVQ
jgi:hypothetical protein